MPHNLTIRKASESDADSIIQFNIAMAMETEGKTLKRDEIEPGVQALFKKPEYGFYIVAVADGKLVGSLMVTFEWSDWRNGVIWWIQSVYVIPEFRRNGVYRSMYSKIKKMADREPDVQGFRLYVEKENIAAQKTYGALGMEETQYKMFEDLGY